MKHIAKQISALKNATRKFYLYLVPRRTLICEIILERSGVYDAIQKPIGEYALDLIPFDNDVCFNFFVNFLASFHGNPLRVP